MNKSDNKQVFEIIDAMYNSLSKKADSDPEIMKVLMTAGVYLNEKKSSSQLIAAKTVNGILLANLSNKSKLDQANWNRLNQLMILAKTGGPMGPADLRAQF